ncbi:MAG: carotenoid biosynthesis protein [Deinococcales bacterium]
MLTNILVVCGLSLALSPESLTRLKGMLKQVKLWQGAFSLWLLSMILTPLLPQAFETMSYISTTLLALGCLLLAGQLYGLKAYLLFGLSFIFGLTIEAVGARFGIPFGRYRYAPSQFSLLGVPLFVPLGWWAFSFLALHVSASLATGKRSFARLWLAPLILVIWDLALDPLMVSKGFWQFEVGVYFGVPLSNFLGWYVAGVVLVGGMGRLEPSLLTHPSSPTLNLIFTLQSFLMTFGLIFFGLSLAALIFTLLISPILYLSWSKQWQSYHLPKSPVQSQTSQDLSDKAYIP